MVNELTFCELRKKDIVNAADGKKLGRITDIVFSVKGELKGIVAPYGRRATFFKAQEIFIPYCNIKKIGEDVIIVELTPEFCGKNYIDFKERRNDKYACYDRHEQRYDNCGDDCRPPPPPPPPPHPPPRDNCDHLCEKCMLFECKNRWKDNRQGESVFVDNKKYRTD